MNLAVVAERWPFLTRLPHRTNCSFTALTLSHTQQGNLAITALISQHPVRDAPLAGRSSLTTKKLAIVLQKPA